MRSTFLVYASFSRGDAGFVLELMLLMLLRNIMSGTMIMIMISVVVDLPEHRLEAVD